MRTNQPSAIFNRRALWASSHASVNGVACVIFSRVDCPGSCSKLKWIGKAVKHKFHCIDLDNLWHHFYKAYIWRRPCKYVIDFIEFCVIFLSSILCYWKFAGKCTNYVDNWMIATSDVRVTAHIQFFHSNLSMLWDIFAQIFLLTFQQEITCDQALLQVKSCFLLSRFLLYNGHLEFLILSLAGWRSGIEKGVWSACGLGRSKTFENINSRDDIRSLYECYTVTRS